MTKDWHNSSSNDRHILYGSNMKLRQQYQKQVTMKTISKRTLRGRPRWLCFFFFVTWIAGAEPIPERQGCFLRLSACDQLYRPQWVHIQGQQRQLWRLRKGVSKLPVSWAICARLCSRMGLCGARIVPLCHVVYCTLVIFKIPELRHNSSTTHISKSRRVTSLHLLSKSAGWSILLYSQSNGVCFFWMSQSCKWPRGQANQVCALWRS